MIILICQSVWKTVKCQGKIREKSENFEVGDKWQAWVFFLFHTALAVAFFRATSQDISNSMPYTFFRVNEETLSQN